MQEDENKAREMFATRIKELNEYAKHTMNLLKQFNRLFGDENRFVSKYTMEAVESLVDVQVMLGVQTQINQLILEKNNNEGEQKQVNEIPNQKTTKP